jgi:hypothetical protein
MPASNPEDEVNALFKLPLAEFTGARNALSARLKKSGRGDEAVAVKSLAKPSISAGAVNQLYWNHREAFDQLIASGERFHKAQASRGGGKVADMREALDARREALSELSNIAARVLREAGHNPSPDTIHRITTTLEGISAYSSRADGPRAGRLTHDVDPPGFESFASFAATGVQSMRSAPPTVARGSKSGRKQRHPPATAGGTDLVTTNKRRKVAADDQVRRIAETRKAKIADARAVLQDAKSSLTEARARARSIEAAQIRAQAEVKQAERHKSEVEERLKKAKAAVEDATRRARNIEGDVEGAVKNVAEAERAVEEASEELESLISA